MKQEKNPFRVVFLLGAIALMIYWGTSVFNNQNTETTTDNSLVQVTDNNTQDVIVEVIGKDEQMETYTVSYSGDQTVLQILQKLQGENVTFTFVYQQYDFGAFVTGINGYVPSSAEAFWEFKINGESSMVGISDYTVQPSDKIEFVLTNIDPNYQN